MSTDSLPIPGTTGLASVLRWFYYNAAEQVYRNDTGAFETWTDANYAAYQVSGVSELGTSGVYTVTTPVAVAALPSYLWIVRKIVGGTPATDPQQGAGGQNPEGTVTVQSGTPLPATRDLPFYHYLGTPPVLTDVSAGPTVTVIRTDGGGTVYAAGTAMTHAATGVYRLTVPENGLGLQYTVAYEYPAGVPHTRVFTSFAAGLHYASVQSVYNELGQDNTLIWSNLSSSGANEDSPAMIDDSLRQSDGRVNRKLALASPPPAAFPVTSTAAWVTDDIRTAATKYAAGILLNKRDRQSAGGKPHGRDQLSAGDLLIADGDDILDALVLVNLPGVTVTTTTADSDLNPLSVVSVAATKDACGCPLPAAACGYGYRSRLYTYQ